MSSFDGIEYGNITVITDGDLTLASLESGFDLFVLTSELVESGRIPGVEKHGERITICQLVFDIVDYLHAPRYYIVKLAEVAYCK